MKHNKPYELIYLLEKVGISHTAGVHTTDGKKVTIFKKDDRLICMTWEPGAVINIKYIKGEDSMIQISLKELNEIIREYKGNVIQWEQEQEQELKNKIHEEIKEGATE